MTLTTQDQQSEAAKLRIRRHRARLLMQHPWYGSIDTLVRQAAADAAAAAAGGF
jgi:hypothetical protein